ncbi:hypothetical protein VTK26DRAFT_1367 [Humicola hyalothermophila]
MVLRGREDGTWEKDISFKRLEEQSVTVVQTQLYRCRHSCGFSWTAVKVSWAVIFPQHSWIRCTWAKLPTVGFAWAAAKLHGLPVISPQHSCRCKIT